MTQASAIVHRYAVLPEGPGGLMSSDDLNRTSIYKNSQSSNPSSILITKPKNGNGSVKFLRLW
ncbi:hypothetical protein PGT21_006837 [Puccinia graminis f. sp. tritici]|uniref:Uncharacterized protein n=1 Tax=Puccinia graminis f. sp. tritici TaxID=56615 RepID=A0A5B0MBM7_PUCGR|nr:hypothetical protein PGTUg99_030991 [Puccinia graminis f. sp. tritici]KAA1116256.1 hypothetical protein PGT21_006837 [Puccinia graminis f. sp. tritici]